MKTHITENMTRGKKRNLNAFSAAMLQLISEQSFDDITVSGICERSGFPRATFYNYFHDKFDLIQYCWTRLTGDLDIRHGEQSALEDVLLSAFDQLYIRFKNNEDYMKKVLKHHSFDSQLIGGFSDYLNQEIKKQFHECLNHRELSMPVELVSSHYSNTVLLLLRWIFIEGHHLTIEAAHMYLKHLLTGTEKNSLTDRPD